MVAVHNHTGGREQIFRKDCNHFTAKKCIITLLFKNEWCPQKGTTEY